MAQVSQLTVSQVVATLEGFAHPPNNLHMQGGCPLEQPRPSLLLCCPTYCLPLLSPLQVSRPFSCCVLTSATTPPTASILFHLSIFVYVSLLCPWILALLCFHLTQVQELCNLWSIHVFVLCMSTRMMNKSLNLV